MAAAASGVVDEAFVTLVTTDSYTRGACVLGHSLRKTRTTKLLVVVVTPKVGSDSRFVLLFGGVLFRQPPLNTRR